MRKWGNIALRDRALRLLEDAEGTTKTDKIRAIVAETGFTSVEFSPDPEISHVLGAVFYESQRILINSEMPESERLFTLAHELGHVLLHPQKDHMDFRFKKINQEQNDEESEANIFAYELVMPFTEFTKAYRDHDGDTFAIAEVFAMTEERVARRLSFLEKQIKEKKISNFISVE